MYKRVRENRYDEGSARKRFYTEDVELNYDDEEKDQTISNQTKSKGKNTQKRKAKNDKTTNSSDQVTSGELNLEVGQRIAFPGISNSNFSASDGPPLSVMEYISSVRHEAEARPPVVSVKLLNGKIKQELGEVDEAQYNQDLTHTNELSDKSMTLTPAAIIDIQWHTQFIKEFQNLRQHELPAQSSTTLSLPQTANEWRQYLLSPSNQPSNSLINSFDLPLVLKLINYFYRRWLSPKVHPQLSKWIFALLIRLPPILNGDDTSILRELAKKCRTIQAENPSLDSTTKFTLDMIISVVAGLFGQNDLLYT